MALETDKCKRVLPCAIWFIETNSLRKVMVNSIALRGLPKKKPEIYSKI